MVGLLTIGGCAGRSPQARESRFEFEAIEMAIPFRIVLYARDGSQATNAARAAFERIHALNGLLSDYDPDSELSRLSRTAGTDLTVPISPELATVLRRAQDVSAASHGAFDVTVGPLTQLWRRSRRQRELPSPGVLKDALSAVGWQYLELNPSDPNRRRPRASLTASPSDSTARLRQAKMRLDLGGIAKGYALDEATRVLRSRGFRRTLITGAGDMVAGDPPPGARGWKIDLAPLDFPDAPPMQSIWLKNGSLCTSGDLFQHVEIAGIRYSHIVNPQTGLGLTNHSLVTVIGHDGMTTDALSTAFSVLPAAEALRLSALFGVKSRIIAAPNGRLELKSTSTFPR